MYFFFQNYDSVIYSTLLDARSYNLISSDLINFPISDLNLVFSFFHHEKIFLPQIFKQQLSFFPSFLLFLFPTTILQSTTKSSTSTNWYHDNWIKSSYTSSCSKKGITYSFHLIGSFIPQLRLKNTPPLYIFQDLLWWTVSLTFPDYHGGIKNGFNANSMYYLKIIHFEDTYHLPSHTTASFNFSSDATFTNKNNEEKIL